MTKTLAAIGLDRDLMSIGFAAMFGLALLFTAGFANGAAMHDTAHDTRHAIGFPCH
jgi:cobalt transporter subunit CbtB